MVSDNVVSEGYVTDVMEHLRGEAVSLASVGTWNSRTENLARTMSIDLSVHSCLADVEDLMGPLHAWPVWARELLLKQHLSDSERYTLTLFVMGNKLPPFTYARFLRANGSLKDRRARQHVIDQLRRYQTGRNSGQCTYWDIDLKHSSCPSCAP